MLLLTNKTIDKLKHDLVREGLVDIEGLSFAENKVIENETNLGVELVNANLISEADLLNFIEKKLHIPFVELDDYTPDIKCLSYISGEQASKHKIFPLFKIEDVLTIAMSDPLDLFTINELFKEQAISIEPIVASDFSIDKAINTYYFKQNDATISQNWQDKLISANLTDELLKETIFNIIYDAIDNNYEHIAMESHHSDLSIYFNKDLKGYIPNILVPRFISELKLLANLNIDEVDLAQSSKFWVEYKNKKHIVISSIFPTLYGTRIALSIYKPLPLITDFNISEDNINKIFASPTIVGINAEKQNPYFFYSLAQYLSNNFEVLLVESDSIYDLQDVTQIEFKKNTSIHFDEIINQIEHQKFDIILWEKVYTSEQLEKLRLLSNDISVVTYANTKTKADFDYILNV